MPFVKLLVPGLLIGARVRPVGAVVEVAKIQAEQLVKRSRAQPAVGPESEPAAADSPKPTGSKPAGKETQDLKSRLAASGNKVETAAK